MSEPDQAFSAADLRDAVEAARSVLLVRTDGPARADGCGAALVTWQIEILVADAATGRAAIEDLRLLKTPGIEAVSDATLAAYLASCAMPELEASRVGRGRLRPDQQVFAVRALLERSPALAFTAAVGCEHVDADLMGEVIAAVTASNRTHLKRFVRDSATWVSSGLNVHPVVVAFADECAPGAKSADLPLLLPYIEDGAAVARRVLGAKDTPVWLYLQLAARADVDTGLRRRLADSVRRHRQLNDAEVAAACAALDGAPLAVRAATARALTRPQQTVSGAGGARIPERTALVLTAAEWDRGLHAVLDIDSLAAATLNDEVDGAGLLEEVRWRFELLVWMGENFKRAEIDEKAATRLGCAPRLAALERERVSRLAQVQSCLEALADSVPLAVWAQLAPEPSFTAVAMRTGRPHPSPLPSLEQVTTDAHLRGCWLRVALRALLSHDASTPSAAAVVAKIADIVPERLLDHSVVSEVARRQVRMADLRVLDESSKNAKGYVAGALARHETLRLVRRGNPDAVAVFVAAAPTWSGTLRELADAAEAT